MGKDLSTVHRRVLTASESTQGTDAIDIAGNLAVNRTYHSLDAIEVVGNTTLKPRPVTRGAASRVDHVMVRNNLGVTASGFITAGRNPGVDNRPHFRDWMVAAGMSEVVNGVVDVTYARSTTHTNATSVYDYQRHVDDYTFRLVKALGVRGNLKGELPAGELATWSFEDGQSVNFPYDKAGAVPATDAHLWTNDLAFFDASGLIDLDQNGASVVYTGTEEYDETPAMCVESSTCVWGANDYAIKTWTFDLGWTVVPRSRTRASPVVEEVFLVDNGGVKLNFTLDDAGLDFEEVIRQGLDFSTVAIVTTLTDGTGAGGSRLTVTAPRVQIDWPTLRDDAGLAMFEIPAFANGDASASMRLDNEIEFVWSVTP